ncbi:tetratricopeptide repeat protein [Paraburkholderia sp. J76]|uniref:tetratricopeptide repeat protein n=1 Tax=Paraburkholderia sp. J76 TaxID=2805439 RepID=UPI002ABE4298|nr:tetratricopeptide repeat protein [Paraburkholderia sp. J76]
MNTSAAHPQPLDAAWHAAWHEALAAHTEGRHEAALGALERVLHAQPAHARALELAARTLAGGAPDRAAAPFATPDAQAQAYRGLGAWLYRRGRFAAASHAYRRVLSIRPDDMSARADLALALMNDGCANEAEAELSRALEIDPHHPGVLFNQGLLMWRVGRLAQAEAAYLAVLAQHPDHVAAWNNLGLLYKEMNRLPESEAACRRALALDDSHPEIHNNLGNALWQLGQVEASIEPYRRALALRPDYAAARVNLALPLLRLGAYEAAWPLYEARHEPSMGEGGVARPPVPYPQWQGEALAGKSILVWPEQGLGDCLQFCRYVPMLKALGAAQVSIACAPALARLFETLAGADRVIALDGRGIIERHDFWCLTMSLPLRFGTTVASIPARVPYLHANEAAAQAWRARLPAGALKVGLVWAGNPSEDKAGSHAIDQRRSLDARAFVPLLRTPGVTFVSLQLGATTRPQIAGLPAALRPFDPMDEVRDFADTAAIVANLDLVITVDTSMAHLAGALGKPVWVLSRYGACWRWLGDGDDSPWYPTARLFRQGANGAWDDVLRRVEEALAARARHAGGE